MKGRLIVASNRTASPGAPPVGGLAVALWDALSERGGVWFGWSGDTVERETRGVRLFAEGNVDFALADLTESELQGYYLGYANRALWPVFHYRVDLAQFDEHDFASYEKVNRRFGRVLAQLTRPDDTVWVHDYHFLMLGQEMRQSGWDGPMGFFLHIPFPAPEIFTALPQHQRLARALCAFDLVGFQTDRDTANFRRYLTEYCGASIEPDGAITVFDRSLRAASFPIGIDAEEIATLAESEEGRSAASRLGKIIDNRSLVIGVDRMDYSKGLPQRMEAFGRMLDDHEELQGRVSFLQIAPPPPEAGDAYQGLPEQLDLPPRPLNG
ncbi:alpha,alpha-trehalose-phosphate synthase (UDP-forming), partial [Amaricoccus sp.]|uniref:alpha,alpha-trehalose-phosphate synthase (UDP-forming) n=1 Tax=Amaricoccus sp. TaxID=1872485 RepID=UPI002B7BDCBE